MIGIRLNWFRKIALLATFGLFLYHTGAQNSQTFYFMEDAPGAALMNPAFAPDDDLVLGLPVISGISIGFHNDFKLKNLYSKGNSLFSSDTAKMDLNSFYDVLSGQNAVNIKADALMFYFGIRNKKNQYSFFMNEKAWFQGQFDKKLVKFFMEGTKPYYEEGTDTDLGIFSFDIMQYREFGLGISRKVTNKLTGGAALKILFGRIHMEAEELAFQIQTSPAVEKLYIRPSGEIYISGPVSYEKDTVDQSERLKSEVIPADYFFNFRNLGVAADLGIRYQYNERFRFSASVTDLGFLHFSKNNYLVHAANSLEYEKESLTQVIGPEDSYLFRKAFRDSIPFMTHSESTDARVIPLPVNLYLGGNYRIDRKWEVGFSGKLCILKNSVYPVATLAAKASFSDNSTLIFSNSIIRGRYINPGFGWSYTSPIMHFYVVTDNIVALFSPSSVKNLNLQLGINLLLNH